MSPEAERIEDEVKTPTIGKFAKVEPKAKRQLTKRIIASIQIFAALGVIGIVIFISAGIWSWTHPAMIMLPVDDVARMVAAKSKYDQAMAPISSEFNKTRSAVISRYNIPEGSTPVATVDGSQLTGWLAPDHSQIILRPDDMATLKSAFDRFQAAAKAPSDEFANVEKDVKARNKVPATDEPVFAGDASVVGYKAKK